jgi:hypothetical protein
MDIPSIYNFTDRKYQPIIRYLFILPHDELLEFFKALAQKEGIARELHGFEIHNNEIEFWDLSTNREQIVTLPIKDFLQFIEPFLNKYRDHPDLSEIRLLIEVIKDHCG